MAGSNHVTARQLRQQMFGVADVAEGADAIVRLSFADCARGLAVILAILCTLIAQARPLPIEFAWLGHLGVFLNSFALPALMTYAGMSMRRDRNMAWPVYTREKLSPVLFALAAWLVAAALLGLLFAGTESKKSAAALAGISEALPLAGGLLGLTLFVFAWKLLASLRTGTILVLAALVELLHNQQSGSVGLEVARGFVYFAAGHCWGHHLRALAQYSGRNRLSSLALIAVWGAFNALLTLHSLDFGPGGGIATLPFASLGLGLAGVAALTLCAGLIAVSRRGAWVAATGRKWLVLFTAAPIAVFALAKTMVAIGLFAAVPQAQAALIFAILGAGATLAALEWRAPHVTAGF